MNLMSAISNQLIQRMTAQFQSNPVFQQAQQMAKGKSEEELKQTCMNICKSKGLDFDQAFNQFQSQFAGLR